MTPRSVRGEKVMEDYRNALFFWRSVIAYLALLGVQLILLGIALAGWVNAKKRREQETLK
jgi:hypothetical protein